MADHHDNQDTSMDHGQDKPENLHDKLPGAVLFACNHNMIRSPIAEGLMKSMFPNRILPIVAGLTRARRMVLSLML